MAYCMHVQKGPVHTVEIYLNKFRSLPPESGLPIPVNSPVMLTVKKLRKAAQVN